MLLLKVQLLQVILKIIALDTKGITTTTASTTKTVKTRARIVFCLSAICVW